MSLLKISSKAEPKDGEIKAIASYPFLIYKRAFPPGDFEIKLSPAKKGASVETQLIAFYAVNNKEVRNLACGGCEHS